MKFALDLDGSDFVVIFLYLFCLAAITIRHTRHHSETADFLLAGRKLTLPVFVATLVSTFYGGIFGISEFVGFSGLGCWLVQGIFWYVVYLLFAIFLAGRIRSLQFYTIPDILEDRYGRGAALLGGIFTFVMVNPAPYILSLGIIVSMLCGCSLASAVIIGTLITVVYTISAGFRGVVYTDALQFVLMYLGFLLLAYFVVERWTAPGYELWARAVPVALPWYLQPVAIVVGKVVFAVAFLQQNLTQVAGFEHHLTLTGGMSWGYILAWAGIACWVFVDPNFYQRCYAARNPGVARRGILFAVVLWAIFDILTCTTALYAFAAHNAGAIVIGDSKLAYLVLAKTVLPSPLKGLFLAGVISTIMSTADSFLFAGAINISRDYYWRWFNRQAEAKQMVLVTRLAIIATAVLAAGLALAMPSVVDLWYTLGTIGVSALLVPMMFTFIGNRRLPWTASASMLAGAAISVTWFGISRYWPEQTYLKPLYPYLQPLYAGLIASLAVFIAGYFCEKNKL